MAEAPKAESLSVLSMRMFEEYRLEVEEYDEALEALALMGSDKAVEQKMASILDAREKANKMMYE